jgi:hypothetical protein
MSVDDQAVNLGLWDTAGQVKTINTMIIIRKRFLGGL